jgi:hypothetical protein
MKIIIILVTSILLTNSCYANENRFGKRINVNEFTNINSIEIFIRSSNGPYSFRGGFELQIETLIKSEGISISIGSILQIMEYENKLELEKFKPVKNFEKFIKSFETYAVFKINSKTETIILAYDGKYLLNVTHKKYKKLKDKSILNFDPL